MKTFIEKGFTVYVADDFKNYAIMIALTEEEVDACIDVIAARNNRDPQNNDVNGIVVRNHGAFVCYVIIDFAEFKNFVKSSDDLVIKTVGTNKIIIRDKDYITAHNFIAAGRLIKQYANAYENLPKDIKSAVDDQYNKMTYDDIEAIEWLEDSPWFIENKEKHEDLLKKCAYELIRTEKAGNKTEYHAALQYCDIKEDNVSGKKYKVELCRTKDIDSHISYIGNLLFKISGKYKSNIVDYSDENVYVFKDLTVLEAKTLLFEYDEYVCSYDVMDYERGSDYRKYIHYGANCVYCGYTYDFMYMQADHIIPIHAVNYGPLKNYYRNFMKRHHYNEGVNDRKNIVPACAACNARKGKKTGLWLIRGFLGRFFPRWGTLRTIAWYIVAGTMTIRSFIVEDEKYFKMGLLLIAIGLIDRFIHKSLLAPLFYKKALKKH